MNLYTIIILSTLLLEFTITLTADFLNLKTLTPNLPREFEDIYDKKAYEKSQRYTRAQTGFGLLKTTIHLIIILVFWFYGGFNTLDTFVRGWGWGSVATGLAYIGTLMLALAVFSLPFNIYSTFVIEQQFGFNQTTPRTFVTDLVKGFALSILLGTPLLAAVLAFFQDAGPYAWITCWIITTVFILFIQFVAPTWIMPLFNKFKPLEDGDLKTRILEYARSVDFPLAGVYVMDGSRRSSKANAFFTGFGKNKRIVLYDTLIAKHTVDELVTILAHEVGHYKKKHILINMVISILHIGIMFFLLSVFLRHRGLYEAFYMDRISVYAGLIFFGMLYSPVELFLSVLMNILSRRHEYQADDFAISTTRQAGTFITALKKLSVHNLANLTPHPFYVFLNNSHPSILQRINTIRKIGEKFS
jgi:STE24 endopeptidase